jgi:hypothetical protein
MKFEGFFITLPDNPPIRVYSKHAAPYNTFFRTHFNKVRICMPTSDGRLM